MSIEAPSYSPITSEDEADISSAQPCKYSATHSATAPIVSTSPGTSPSPARIAGAVAPDETVDNSPHSSSSMTTPWNRYKQEDEVDITSAQPCKYSATHSATAPIVKTSPGTSPSPARFAGAVAPDEVVDNSPYSMTTPRNKDRHKRYKQCPVPSCKAKPQKRVADHLRICHPKITPRKRKALCKTARTVPRKFLQPKIGQRKLQFTSPPPSPVPDIEPLFKGYSEVRDATKEKLAHS